MERVWIDSFDISFKSAFRNLKSAILLGVMLLALSVPSVDAQQPMKVPRIGFLSAPSRSAQSARHEAFRQGLRELGYMEGKNIVIEWRYAEGQLERLPDLAAELVRLKVDVIVAGGLPAARAAKQVTTTIPIVMTGGDPVRAGIIASLARPGGNVTGLSDSTVDVSTKRLELLKEVIPKLSRVAILWNPANPTNPLQLKDTQAAAPALGMTVYSVEVKEVGELERAFTGIKRERAGGLLVPASACGTTTVDGLGLFTAFGFCDYDTEVIATLRTGSAKVYGHSFNLTLRIGYTTWPKSPAKLGP
jgi:putative tryptophan/tyrosine transport system substrate-binding protein